AGPSRFRWESPPTILARSAPAGPPEARPTGRSLRLTAIDRRAAADRRRGAGALRGCRPRSGWVVEGSRDAATEDLCGFARRPHRPACHAVRGDEVNSIGAA